MPRKTATSIRVNPNVRCLRIYPIEGTPKKVVDLQTVGLRLSRDQAIHLARVLLAMSQDFDFIDITGRRLEKRKSDGTFGITVTAMAKE